MQTSRSSRLRRWSALALVPAAALAFGGLAVGGGAADAQGDEVGTAATRTRFVNTTRIVIRDSREAEPYPSTILVQNLPKRLYDVNVHLIGLRHLNPDDIDVMLVAPNGARATIMADAGGSHDVPDVSDDPGIDLTLDDETANALPDSEQLQGAPYKPRNYQGGDDFATTTDNVLLGTFDRIDPNGEWKLYVRDDRSDNTGEIVNGWELEIYYGQAPVAVDDSYTARRDRRLEVSARNGVLANDNDGDPEPGVDSELTARLDNPPDKGTVRLRADGSFVYRPNAGAKGEDTFTYTLRDQDGLTDTGMVTITID